jgi:hypothetical protein
LDFNTEARGKDADTHSPTLQAYHQALWSKQLPSGEVLHLVRMGTRGRLYLAGHFGSRTLELSSDAITNRFRRSQVAVSLGRDEAPRNLGYTIGSALVFPRAKREGKQTINQRRGTHPRIGDRFDLTLECIRRHYAGIRSPLEDVVERYADFFELFRDFQGYIDFFLLQDLVSDDYKVQFLHEFQDFTTPPVPTTKTAYLAYLERSNSFILARNRRIATWATVAKAHG